MHLVFGLFLLSISWTVCAESKLSVVADEYPPYAYVDSEGTFKGISVDLIRAVLKEAGINVEVELMVWPDSLNRTLKEPNTMILSLIRSERRQNMFQWVGDIMGENIYLYQLRKRKNIELPNLKAARRYRVGGVKRYDSTVWLTQNGVPVLELDETWIGLKMLETESLDLMPFYELHLAFESARRGINAGHFMKAYKIDRRYFAFAMNKDSDPKLVNKLRKAYERFKNKRYISENSRSIHLLRFV